MRLLIGFFLLIVLISIFVFNKKKIITDHFISSQDLTTALADTNSNEYKTIVQNNCMVSSEYDLSSCDFKCENKLNQCYVLNEQELANSDFCTYDEKSDQYNPLDCNSINNSSDCRNSDYCYTGSERCENRNFISNCFNYYDEESCNADSSNECEWSGWCNNKNDCNNFDQEDKCNNESNGRCEWNNDWGGGYCEYKNCNNVDNCSTEQGCVSITDCLPINGAYIENLEEPNNPLEFNCNNLPDEITCPTKPASNDPNVSDCYQHNTDSCPDNCTTITKNVKNGSHVTYDDYGNEMTIPNVFEDNPISACVPNLQSDPGYYLKLNRDNTLETTQCPPGTYGENGICIKCDINQFSSNPGAETCQEKRTCDENEYVQNNYNINYLVQHIPEEIFSNLSIDNKNKIIDNLNKSKDVITNIYDRNCVDLSGCNSTNSEYITNLNYSDSLYSLKNMKENLDKIRNISEGNFMDATGPYTGIDMGSEINNNQEDEELKNTKLRFSNYNCSNLTSCNNTEYVSNYGTQISNMVSINDNNYYTSDRECANLDDCNRGYRDMSDIESSKLDNGMYTENRECTMCDSGKYTNTINQSQCNLQPFCGKAQRLNYTLDSLIRSIDVKLITNSSYQYPDYTTDTPTTNSIDIHHFRNFIYPGPDANTSQSYPNVKIEFEPDTDNDTRGHMKVYYYDTSVNMPNEENYNIFFHEQKNHDEHMEAYSYEKYEYEISDATNYESSLTPITFKKLKKIIPGSTTVNEFNEFGNDTSQNEVSFEEYTQSEYDNNKEYQFTLNYNSNTGKIIHKRSDDSIVYEIFSESGLPKTERITCDYCPEYEYQDADEHRNIMCKTQPVCGPGQYYGPTIQATERTSLVSCSNCNIPHTYVNDDNHRLEECITQPTLPINECALDYNPTNHVLRLQSTTPDGINTYIDVETDGHRENCKQHPYCDKGQLISPTNPTQRRTCNDIVGRGNCERYDPESGYMDLTDHREVTAKTNAVCPNNEIRCGTENKQDCTFAESRCLPQKDCATDQKIIRTGIDFSGGNLVIS